MKMGINLKWKGLEIIFILLYFAQLFMVVQGTDVSPYAYKYNLLHIIKFYGLTLSAWVCALAFIYCITMILFNKKIVLHKNQYIIAILIVIFSLSTVFTSLHNLLDEIDNIVKLVFPFIIYIFLVTNCKNVGLKSFNNFFAYINLFLLGQVLVCKIITGRWGVNNYYYEIENEFFGFYNSPHPFSATLGILCIWCIYCIQQKRKILFYGILFILNYCLIFLCSVRSYLLAATISVTYIVIKSVGSKIHISKVINNILFVLLGIAIIYTLLFGNVMSVRQLGGDFSSGRIYRWIQDLRFYMREIDTFRKIAGSGANTICNINTKLIGTYINSLNAAIDILIDNGIIGLLLLGYAYLLIFKECKKNYFYYALWIYIAVGAGINNLLPYVSVMPLAMVMAFAFSQTNNRRSEESNENISITSSTVSQDQRERRMVGRGIYRVDKCKKGKTNI